ncbi:hypothetical protein FLA_5057 [Filimonas lacunae]|nr:hypothetical protein FLA_5057 [Filimonas lacunae]
MYTLFYTTVGYIVQQCNQLLFCNKIKGVLLIKYYGSIRGQHHHQ